MRSYFFRHPELVSILALFAAVLLIGGLTSDSSQSQDVPTPAIPSGFRGVEPPIPAALLTPSENTRSYRGNFNTDQPIVLSWQPIPDAVWYRLHVTKRNGKNIFKHKFLNIDEICSDEICSVHLRDLVAVPSGNYRWWIVTKNQDSSKVKTEVSEFKVEATIQPTATPDFNTDGELPRLSRTTDGDKIEIVPFGDTSLLQAELDDPATEIIYLMPDAANTDFNITEQLLFGHDVVVYANNAKFTKSDPNGLDEAIIHIQSTATVELHHIHVTNTHNYLNYGGGIKNTGTLTIYDSSFTHNSALNGGAGIDNSGSLSILRTEFRNNSSGGGAGIQNDGGGAIDIECSRFLNNSATYGSGILNGNGGGTNLNDNGQIKVRYSALYNNTATLTGAKSDIHNLITRDPEDDFLVDARGNWWGTDGIASVTTNNVWLTDNGQFSSILDDDPTIAPYTDYPQCQPRLPRLVSEEAVPFHVYAEEFGLPMPFDRLPYNVVQTGQSTVEISPGVTVNANDPLGWFRDTITPQQTTQYVQGFGPTSWAYGSYLKDNLYKLTFATHSGLDYGALDSPFILRVIVSVCDGLIIPGNNTTGTTGGLGGSASPGRGVSVRCFMDSLDSPYGRDEAGNPKLSNIVVTYNHLIWDPEDFYNKKAAPFGICGNLVFEAQTTCLPQVELPTIGDIVRTGDVLGQTGGDPGFDHLHFTVHLAIGFARVHPNHDDNAFYINPLIMYTEEIASAHKFQNYFPLKLDGTEFTDNLGIAIRELNRWAGGGFNSGHVGGQPENWFWEVQDFTVPGPGQVEWPLGQYPLRPANDPEFITEFVEYVSIVASGYEAPVCSSIGICDLSDLQDDTPYVNVPHPLP